MEDWYGLFVAFMYGVVSIAITFFNKAVFSVYSFNASNFLTLGQIVFSLVSMVVLKRLNWIQYNDFDVATAQKMGELGIAFSSMVVSGLAALRFVNIPVYSALRRLTTFIVIVWQFLLQGKTVPSAELYSVVAMVFGAMVAGWGDLTFDFWGYVLTGVNCVVTAWYLVLISKKKDETNLNTFGLMFYNNVLSIPIISLIVLATELDFLRNFERWFDVGFLFCFLMSSALAFLLNYFVFLCSTVNSPLTTSITGQLKSILSTVLGLFLFGGVVLTFSLTVGLLISTVGGIAYGVVKYEQQTQREKAAAAHHVVDLEKGNKP